MYIFISSYNIVLLQAERMLTNDGEFLVRESSNKAGQYVLSGMKGGIVVHLLLVDPEGVVSIYITSYLIVIVLISFIALLV